MVDLSLIHICRVQGKETAMNEILSFSGQLPEHFDAAFAEIGPELGLSLIHI